MRAPSYVASVVASVLSLVGLATTRVGLAQEVPVTASASPSPAPQSHDAELAAADTPMRAVSHYERGRVYYAAGRYRLAIGELEAAARLDPEAVDLYYDLGHVYELVGNVEGALTAYGHFRDHATVPAERERGEHMLQRLRAARVEIADLRPHFGRDDGLFWVTAAVAVAATATGLIVLLTDGSHSVGPSTQQGVGDGMVIGGSALGVVGALLFFARPSVPAHTPLCVRASIDPRGGIGVTVTF